MVNHSNDIIQMQGVNALGFGIIPKLVMQDKRLTIQAKAIYSYFCSYAGAGKTAFPKRSKILADLKISVNTYYRHFNLLKKYGYIEVTQEKDKEGFFDRNIYTLMESLPCTKKQDTDENSPCLNLRDTEKRDTQNKDIIKVTDIKNNSIKNKQSVSQEKEDKTDGPDFAEYVELIRENIGYDELALTHADDMDLINEFVNIILDALLTEGGMVRINGENKPRELVKSNLMKLTYADIEYVLWQFKEHGERIKKKPQYILSMLYHSPMERNVHYTNCVKADWGAGHGTDQR